MTGPQARMARTPSNAGLRALLAAVAIAACIGCAVTQPTDPVAPQAALSGADRENIAALEEAFWYCDYVATTRGVLAAPMAACRFATEELMARKFGGSFQALMDWWQENKAAEHQRLDQATDLTRPSRSDR
jgi:hypothetical protein